MILFLLLFTFAELRCNSTFPNVPACYGHGICRNDACVCAIDYFGIFCNIHAPGFDNRRIYVNDTTIEYFIRGYDLSCSYEEILLDNIEEWLDLGYPVYPQSPLYTNLTDVDYFCSGRGTCTSGHDIEMFPWVQCQCIDSYITVTESSFNLGVTTSKFPKCTDCEANRVGPDCNILYCSANCNGHGTCIGNERCLCERGWGQPACLSCDEGYYGDSCQFFDCSDTAAIQCSNHGTCISPTECRCNAGYIGANCEIPDLAVNINVKPFTCNCISGFCVHSSPKDYCQCAVNVVGEQCDYCDQYWSGRDCMTLKCEGLCGSHGTCLYPNICNCTEEYTGTYCADLVNPPPIQPPPVLSNIQLALIGSAVISGVTLLSLLLFLMITCVMFWILKCSMWKKK